MGIFKKKSNGKNNSSDAESNQNGSENIWLINEFQAKKSSALKNEAILMNQLVQLTTLKKELFSKGFSALEIERIDLVKKINMIDQKIKSKTDMRSDLLNQIKVMDKLIFLLENERIFRDIETTIHLEKTLRDQINLYLEETKEETEVPELIIENIFENVESGDVNIGKIENLIKIWSTSDAAQADSLYETWTGEKQING